MSVYAKGRESSDLRELRACSEHVVKEWTFLPPKLFYDLDKVISKRYAEVLGIVQKIPYWTHYTVHYINQ